MVDTSQKSAPTNKNTTPITKAEDEGGVVRQLKGPSHSRKLPVILGIILVAIAVGLLAIATHVGQKVYAQVAGHKIYKQDVKDLIGKNKGISNHAAAQVLADKYLYQAMAHDQHITVTDQDIRNAYGAGIDQQKNQNEYAYQSRVNDLYYEKLQGYNQGIYKGYLLVAHFSRNIALQPQTQSSFPTNSGNPAAIAADKKYAQDFITNLYNQIKAHKITWDQAAQMEKADHEVGLNMYPSQSHSGPFDTSKITNSLLQTPAAQQQIQKLKSGQTSKPFVVGAISTVGSSNQYFESYFLVVRMDYSAGGGGNLNFAQEIDQVKQKLGYKIYV